MLIYLHNFRQTFIKLCLILGIAHFFKKFNFFYEKKIKNIVKKKEDNHSFEIKFTKAIPSSSFTNFPKLFSKKKKKKC